MDYSGDQDRSYEFESGALSAQEPLFREFAFFVPGSVKLHGKTLEIKGERKIVVQDAKTGNLTPTNIHSPATVSISFKDGNVDQLLPDAVKRLFWPSLNEAVASIPDYVAKFLPSRFDAATRMVKECTDCGPGRHTELSDSAVRIDPRKGVTAPKLIHQVDPEFPEHTHGETMQRSVLVSVMVKADGKPSDIWILRPSGEAFNREAAKAISQYRFEPSRKDGAAVAVRLNIEISWQSFPG